MAKTPLILGTGASFGCDTVEQFRLFKEAGFDGSFTCGEDERIGEFSDALKELGMTYQSVHAPFAKVNALWRENEEEANAALSGIMFSLEQCERYEIPLLVVHPFIGFPDPENMSIDDNDFYKPTEIGLERFGKLIKAAESKGVKIAFENVEGQCYLELLLDTFKDEKNVGFCWDSGHEMCYNDSNDLLGLFGNRLFCTHINDNLGVSRLTGKKFWTDDLHLLPFDGIADWQVNMERLKKTGFSGPLTFELKMNSIPNRHDNDMYREMPLTTYLALAYARACKLRKLFEE